MKTLFNNLLSKILACALVAAVSMPTPAFSATSESDNSLVKELRTRGVWLYCVRDIKGKYERSIKDASKRLLRGLEDAMGQCELENNNLESAKKFFELTKNKGSIISPYLLMQIRYSKQPYIDRNEFATVFNRIQQGDVDDDYFLDQMVMNRILEGLIWLVYVFGEEILLGVSNGEKQEDNINEYMSIINTMFPSESSNCNTLLDDTLSKVQSGIDKLNPEHYLVNKFPVYRKDLVYFQDNGCQTVMANIEKIKATAEEKGITIE